MRPAALLVAELSTVMYGSIASYPIVFLLIIVSAPCGRQDLPTADTVPRKSKQPTNPRLNLRKHGLVK